jgi:hypothetical protein
VAARGPRRQRRHKAGECLPGRSAAAPLDGPRRVSKGAAARGRDAANAAAAVCGAATRGAALREERDAKKTQSRREARFGGTLWTHTVEENFLSLPPCLSACLPSSPPPPPSLPLWLRLAHHNAAEHDSQVGLLIPSNNEKNKKCRKVASTVRASVSMLMGCLLQCYPNNCHFASS